MGLRCIQQLNSKSTCFINGMVSY